MSDAPKTASATSYDSSSDERFTEYYAAASESQTTRDRFVSIREKVLWLRGHLGLPVESLDVADIGCGAGTQARLWASGGHRVCGVDINAPLVGIARERAGKEGLRIRFDVGSATALPYEDASFDVCILPELLEHVPEWEPCLSEAARVLRKGGILQLSTTNRLCPKQDEFNLPLYSWYPRPLKRHYEKLSVTTRPELANFARYPAVHWFDYFQLRDWFAARGIETFDRFDMMHMRGASGPVGIALKAIRAAHPVRWIAQVFTPYTLLFAIKR